jgi:hypothetical protein
LTRFYECRNLTSSYMRLNDRNFRREKRISFSTRAALALDSDRPESREEVSTVDLSESGVKVRMAGQLVPGQMVELYLGNQPDPCRVVWTTSLHASKEFVSGLEFVSPLPDPRRRPVPPSSKFEPIN